MIDLICSTSEHDLDEGLSRAFKRRAFLAILDEEQGRLTAAPTLVDSIRKEVYDRLGED